MRQPLLIMLWLMVGLTCAQTQQGYVKTIGRPNKPGVALSGVSVRVKGGHNAVLSKDDGTFSMLMTGKKNGDAYSLQQVQKTGYELNEIGVIGRQYAFSDKVPLNVVMVSTSQLQADKQRISNNAYNTATKNHNKRLSLLEEQKELGKISMEKYHKEVQELCDKLEKYQSLIESLADHYAHVDYDNLNETEREINICIENGDLEYADSLLQTIFDPIDVLKRNQEALSKIDQRVIEANDLIRQANADMAKVMKQQVKDAEYLYQLYTIALARYDYEKAQKYIVTRAEIDSTQIEWQQDAADFCWNQRQLSLSEHYYNRLIVMYRNYAKSNPDNYLPECAFVLGGLANIYGLTMRTEESEAAFLEAISILRPFAKTYPLTYEPIIAKVQINLSGIYMDKNRLVESEQLLDSALFLFQNIAKQTPSYRNDANLGMGLIQMAGLYYQANRLTSSESCYMQAHEIFAKLIEIDKNRYEPYLQEIYSRLSAVSYVQNNYEDSERWGILAKDMALHLAQLNPNLYLPHLAECQLLLGGTYMAEKHFSDSELQVKAALKIYSDFAIENPMVYLPKIAETKTLLGELYKKMDRMSESLETFSSALEIYKLLVEKEPDVYTTNLAYTQHQLGRLYQSTDNHHIDAEKMLQSALCHYEHLAKNNPNLYEMKISNVLLDLGSLYYEMKHFSESEQMYLTSLNIYERVEAINKELKQGRIAFIQKCLADICFEEKNYFKSDSLYQLSLDIYNKLSMTSPHSYDDIISEILYLQGYIYMTEDRPSMAINALDRAMEILKSMDHTDSEQQHRMDRVLYLLFCANGMLSQYKAAAAIGHKESSILRTLYAEEPTTYQNRFYNLLCDYAYYCIMEGDFRNAEQIAHEGMIVDPARHEVLTNFAAALLFQGKFSDAEIIYRQYKDELKDSFLDDFRQFAEAGVIPKKYEADVERIKKMLNE